MTLLREGTAEDAGFHAQNIEAIGKQIRRWVDAGTPRTLVALIAHNGVIALQEAAGPMTSEPDSPDVQLDSVFPASSLAKPITAAAILMLVEDGLIGLNRPVREYIPEIAGVASDDLMLIHLLTHTSGYDEDKVGHMVTPRPKAPKDLPPPDSTLDPRLQRWLAARYPIAPLRPPGTLMEYCNYNYELLGEIVRRVSAMPFDSFVRERIFEPLGMADTSFTMEPRFEGRLVRHDPNGPFAGITSDAWIDFPFASGGLNTTARDIAEFCQVYLSDGAGLLSPASVREASQNQIPERTQGRMTSPGSGQTIEFPASYGFGWFVQGTHRFPFNGALLPVNTLAHMGFGGAVIWVDPHSATVGVSLGVVNQMPTFQMGSLQDMVIGATL